MAKPDDSTISPDDLRMIRKEADRLLQEANAYGVFPTPINAILEQANIVVAPEDVLNESFLRKMRLKAKHALKRAIGKVLGIVDTLASIIYIDRGVYIVKQTFLKLHETAHLWLPFQRKAYQVVEDSDKELSSEVSDLFDRQANCFASEVLFQLDEFTTRAADYDFGFEAPLELHKHFGSSIYAAIRRYVSRHHRDCAVIILNKPECKPGIGRICTLRRFVASQRFRQRFGNLDLPEAFTDNDSIGQAIPMGGRRMSGTRTIVLKDRNGTRHECVIEGFTQTHQVFVLICPAKSLTSTTVVLPG
jgi:Zn-dependent peptidase ImmA (M78 family)